MHPKKPPKRLRSRGHGSDYAKDHARLLELLGRLERTDVPRDAAPWLDELYRDIDAHFLEEETPDGVFTWLTTLDPELGPEIRALERDHLALRGEIEVLIGRSRAPSAGRPDAAFSEAARAFVAHLRAHEKREREALAKAMND